MKKKIFLILLFLFGINNITYGYNSSEQLSWYIDDPETWTSIYTVPDGKDLIVNRILLHDTTGEIHLRNGTGSDTLAAILKEYDTSLSVTIQDELQVMHTTGGPHTDATIFGYLVDEDEDIEDYVFGVSAGWNKNIFTKEDLQFIYILEIGFLTILTIIIFFERVLLRRKLGIKLF